MAKINFSDLKLEVKENISEVQIGDNTIWVRSWLPMKEKEEFFDFIITNSIDVNTKTCSPLRVEVYFAIAACKYYGQIEFTDEELSTELLEIYDKLDINGVIQRVIDAIDTDELEFMQNCTNDLCESIERYYNSFAGQLSAMSKEADVFNNEVQSLVDKIKNREGLELLEEINSLESK